MTVNRREFVTALAAVAAGAGTAGCLNGDGNGDDDGVNGDDNGENGTNGNGNGIPEPTEADYASWMFDPETAGRDIDIHSIAYREPASVPEPARDDREGLFDAFDAFISVGGGDGAFVFDYAVESVFDDELEQWGVMDAEPAEERGGYAIYDLSETYAVDFDDMVVVGSGHDGVVRAVVDSRTGEAAPYTEKNEDMGLLLDSLGGGHVVEGGAVGFTDDGTAAGTLRNGNDDGTVDVRAAEVFPDEEAVDTEAFEEALIDIFADSLDDDTLEIDAVEQDGRVAVATGTSDEPIFIQL